MTTVEVAVFADTSSHRYTIDATDDLPSGGHVGIILCSAAGSRLDAPIDQPYPYAIISRFDNEGIKIREPV